MTVNPADMDGRYQSADYYTHTDATRAFDQEWQETKARQDQQLDNIETGLGTLKEIGGAMNEELQRHDILIQEVDEKMDKVTKELQTNNMRLKGMVTKVRAGAEWGGRAGGCVRLLGGWGGVDGVGLWYAAQVCRCGGLVCSATGSRPPPQSHELHSLTACTCAPTTSPQPTPGSPALLQMRSTRNFVVDIVLICVLLAIGLYLYNFLK